MKSTKQALLLSILLLFCAGCASYKPSAPGAGIVDELYKEPQAKLLSAELLAEKPLGMQNLAGQVLGIKNSDARTTAAAMIASSPNTAQHSTLDVAPLPSLLQSDQVVRRLVENTVMGKPQSELTFGERELNDFGEKLIRSMENPYSSDYSSSVLYVAEASNKVAFGNVLTAYFTAYKNGGFTLRNGTVLGKPTVDLSLKGGKFVGGVDNDTIVGMLTMFYEALGDYALGTPVYYEIVDTKTNYLAGGKIPTAATYFPRRQLVNGYTNKVDNLDLLKKEYVFVQFLSNIATDQSKALSGSIIRSLGSIDAGWIIMGSFSIGNNETLAKIVETSISSISRRGTERSLILGLGRYRGEKDVVNKILDNYESIYKKVMAVIAAEKQSS